MEKSAEKDAQNKSHLTKGGRIIIFLTGFVLWPVALSLYFAFYNTDREVAMCYLKGVKVVAIFYVAAAVIGFIYGLLGFFS